MHAGGAGQPRRALRADGRRRRRPASPRARAFSASGSRSSAAAGARSRRAAWWPSGTRGGASCACGIRRRRRCPSRTASRGSSACPSSTWRSIAPDVGRRLRNEDHALLSRGDPRPARRDHARPPGEVDGGPPRSTSSPPTRSAARSTTSRSAFDETGRILGAARSLRPRHGRLHAVRHRRPDHHVDAAARALPPAATTRSTSRSPIPTRLRSSPYRGAGRPHGAFVMERMIGLIARELGLEPAEVRRRNFVQPRRVSLGRRA